MNVIFDLDGTLSDASHRIPMLRQLDADTRAKKPIGNEVWEDFYRASAHDAPIMPIINTLKAFVAGGAQVQIWTGRSDFVRAETEDWLTRHCISKHLLKRMRPHGDHTSDVDLKEGWLFEGDFEPHLVFEDRKRVVDMWRRNDIRCCHVGVGDF